MAEEVATAVNDNPVQDTGTPAPATEETKLEVVTEGPDLNPNDFQDSETEEAEASEETEEKPQESDKPLSPKAENRVQQAVNERNEAKAEAERLRQELESLRLREAQLATEQDLLSEVNPETGEYYTPQEVERIAFQKSREQQQQQTAQQRYELEVQQNIMTINNESAQIVQDFPIFDKESPEFKPELAVQAAELLNENLVYDDKGQLIGSNISPYKLYKTIATAYEASAIPNQIKGQKATEQMLAAADNPSSAKPAKASAADEANMSPAEYAKARGLKTEW